MTVSLRPETERLVEERLKDGVYSNAGDLVHAALLALQELDAFELDEQTLDAIDEAEGQIERGEVHDMERKGNRQRSTETDYDSSIETSIKNLRERCHFRCGHTC